MLAHTLGWIFLITGEFTSELETQTSVRKHWQIKSKWYGESNGTFKNGQQSETEAGNIVCQDKTTRDCVVIVPQKNTKKTHVSNGGDSKCRIAVRYDLPNAVGGGREHQE